MKRTPTWCDVVTTVRRLWQRGPDRRTADLFADDTPRDCRFCGRWQHEGSDAPDGFCAAKIKRTRAGEGCTDHFRAYWWHD